MHARLHRLAALGLVALAFACGDPEPTSVSISVVPASGKIAIGKGSSGLLKISGKFDGMPLISGSTVTLETTAGSFEEGGESQATEITTTGVETTVKLYPPSRPTTGTVTVTYMDPYSVKATASVNVTFVTGTVVDLQFTCTSYTVGAWITNEDRGVRCDATPVDPEGMPVRNAQVRFITEAGGFDPLPEDDECGPDAPSRCRKLFVYNPKKDGRFPKDVPPLGSSSTDTAVGEPSWTESVDWTGVMKTRVRNPRDGLATVVAYVEGEGDGLQTTPYVDDNDNDKYDAGELLPAGLTEFETEQTKYIWRQVKVMWTTEAWPTTYSTVTEGQDKPANYTLERGVCGGSDKACKADCDCGATAECVGAPAKQFTLRVVDRNLNPLSANGPENSISFTASPVSNGSVVITESLDLQRDQMGINLEPKTFKIKNPTDRKSYMINTLYSFDVQNTTEITKRDDEKKCATPAAGGDFKITAEISHYACADDTGAPACQHTSFGQFSSGGTPKVATGTLK